ncbi:MAG TPA: ribonuclease P [Methanosarcinaceae archaeon]|nr:ribonuclease P [Methanosarcinaceae archaeon]
MARQRKKQKSLIRNLAVQRIERLFELADDEFGQNPKRSDRYVFLARRIGMRYRVRFPTTLKRRMCKHCRSYLLPGSNARVRLRGRYISVTCLRCNKQMRYPYKSRKDEEVEDDPSA